MKCQLCSLLQWQILRTAWCVSRQRRAFVININCFILFIFFRRRFLNGLDLQGQQQITLNQYFPSKVFIFLTSCWRTVSMIKDRTTSPLFWTFSPLQTEVLLLFFLNTELQTVLCKVYWLRSLNILSWPHSITQRNLFIHGSNWINSRCCVWCCSNPFLWDPKLNTLFWLLSCPCSHSLMRDGISKALIEMVGKHPWMWQTFLGWEKVDHAI